MGKMGRRYFLQKFEIDKPRDVYKHSFYPNKMYF